MGNSGGFALKSVWVRVVLAVVAGLVWWTANRMEQPVVHAGGSVHAAVTGSGGSAAPVATKTVEIHAKKYEFDPAEITLKQGETVKLVLISDDVPHGLAVAGLPIRADMIKGTPAVVVVTPKETGNFAGKCSKFCGSGHRDMHFMVHVVQ